jgi:hypothetical protein
MKKRFLEIEVALLGGSKTPFPRVTVSHAISSQNELELNTAITVKHINSESNINLYASWEERRLTHEEMRPFCLSLP